VRVFLDLLPLRLAGLAFEDQSGVGGSQDLVAAAHAPGDGALAAFDGDAPGAAHDLRAEADRRHLTDDQRTAADKACRYLENNADFVHDDQALAAGWPIASGAVEGAARHLIADRLDITGSGWTVPGAEAVLTLRTVISNGDFPDYWIFHSQQEHERLHPLPDQHIYALQA